MVRRIGIVGGGQLAAFLVKRATDAGDEVTVIDPEPRCPAAIMGAAVITAPLRDRAAVLELGRISDVVTVDLEGVDVDALAELSAAGTEVLPQPEVLRTLTNKLTQKIFLRDAGIPTSEFVPWDGKQEGVVGQLGWPAVNKAATGGYDGRGVAIIRTPADIGAALPVPGFIEAYVEHRMELAVMVARGHDGEIISFSPVEMTFNEEGNLLDTLIAPARIDDDIALEASSVARRTVEAIGGIGIFGVEMFLTMDNTILVNEISPRTHNSGHYTMDACEHSQFDQQYRILTHQPLADSRQTKAAVMFNLLGEPGFEGETVVEGLESLECHPEIHPYLYGKHTCFPLRKMGHVTVTATTVDQALATVAQYRDRIRVRGAHRLG